MVSVVASPIRFHKFPDGLHRGTMTKNTKTKTICKLKQKGSQTGSEKHCVSSVEYLVRTEDGRAHSPSTQTSPAVGEI